jgi:hypothetical protein
MFLVFPRSVINLIVANCHVGKISTITITGGRRRRKEEEEDGDEDDEEEEEEERGR